MQINVFYFFVAPPLNNYFITGRRNYSQFHLNVSKNLLACGEPLVIFDLTDDKDYLKSLKNKLKGKGGIYSILNTENNKQYIGSAKDFYVRLNEHVNYKNNSNVALQSAIQKYGLVARLRQPQI